MYAIRKSILETSITFSGTKTDITSHACTRMRKEAEEIPIRYSSRRRSMRGKSRSKFLTATVLLIWAGSMILQLFRKHDWRFSGRVTSPSNLQSSEDFRYFRGKHRKKILFYTGFCGIPDYTVGFGSKTFEKCPLQEQRNCETIGDRAQAFSSHAVIFNDVDLHSANYRLPPRRHPLQRWVITMEEPPSIFKSKRLDDIRFNWTMTYRQDSDVVMPYGYFQAITKPFHWQNLVKQVSGKTKLVAWFSSHCQSESKRETYLALLQHYVPVDVYSLKCHFKNKDNECSWGHHSDQSPCLDMLSKDYKFYLSFENAICKDYVTEKLFEKMKANVVPVVMGGADYKNIAPKGSYIDVQNFNSVEQLAKRLMYLDKNVTAYLEYFKWKKSFEVVADSHAEYTFSKSFCELCAKLNNASLLPKFYENLYDWWTAGANCKTEQYWTKSDSSYPLHPIRKTSNSESTVSYMKLFIYYLKLAIQRVAGIHM